MCGALDDDTEEGPTEEGGGAESEGRSEEELGMRQSAEEGVLGPEDWPQEALPPPVAFGDCLSRMFIVVHVLQITTSTAMHSHFIVSSLPATVWADHFIGIR